MRDDALEKLRDVLDRLPDEKVSRVIGFVYGLAAGLDIKEAV